ncbi:MAG: tetratricopeptide repeat protein [Terracidiphilus sp.]
MKYAQSLLPTFLLCATIFTGAQQASTPPNASLLAARTANKDKRYTDAEALMLKVTASQPELLYPWIELGTAQIGLKKYAEAEHSFAVAVGTAAASPNTSSTSGMNKRPDILVDPASANSSTPTVNPFGATVTGVGTRSPDFLAVAYSNLGEIYARTGRISDAQAAFDAAVKYSPSQAVLFRRNEAIFFFQAGKEDAQLDAAQKAIALDPGQAIFYYFKGQALVSKATVDPATQKIILPPECAEALIKYMQLEPNGQFVADARNILSSAGVPIPANRKK